MIVFVGKTTLLVEWMQEGLNSIIMQDPTMEADFNTRYIMVQIDDAVAQSAGLKPGWAYDPVAKTFSKSAEILAQETDDAGESARLTQAKQSMQDLRELAQGTSSLTTAQTIRVFARVCLFLMHAELKRLR